MGHRRGRCEGAKGDRGVRRVRFLSDFAAEWLPLRRLVQLLRAHPSPQMQYQLAFCFWLLSFDQTIAEQINS